MATRDELEKKFREAQREADLRRRVGADLLEDHGVPVQRAPNGEVTDPDLKAKLDDLGKNGVEDAHDLSKAIVAAEAEAAHAGQEWIASIWGPSGPP